MIFRSTNGFQNPSYGDWRLNALNPSQILSYDTDSDEEPDPEPQRGDASVILRRGIAFGPELGPDETEETTKSRGVYFTCYQRDIRDGFNFLVTRKPLLH